MESKTKHKDIKSEAATGWTAQQTARRNKFAEYLFQKYSIDKARERTQADLELPSYSRQTAYNDYKALLKEWQKKRVENVDSLVGAEIAEIEYTQKRLWQRVNERNGRRKVQKTKGRANGTDERGKVKLTPLSGQMEEAEDDSEIRYIHEINELAKEKRKLLGMYAPEKREISNGTNFAQAMMAEAVTKAQRQTGNQSADLAADGKPIDWNEI